MLEFHSGPAPIGFKPEFESFLFNTKAHRLTQTRRGWKEFHLVNKKAKKIFASVAFHVQGRLARSPLRAPFGSYELSNKVQLKELIAFVSNVDSELMTSGVKRVELINPPESYSTTHNTLTSSLIAQGYSPIQCDLSVGIKIDRYPLISKMNKGKRKQFRHGLKLNFKFRQNSRSKLSAVYDFIKSCREEKNQSLSLTKKEVKKIVGSLPKSFFLFGVHFNKKLIASSICIQVRKDILYTFYSASGGQYETQSPLTFLLANLYDWCYKKNILLLDMGTSTLKGRPNFTLLDFKLRVGGVISPKFAFHKKLS